MKDYAIIWAVDSVSYESYLPLKEIVKKKVSEDMQDRAFEALFKGCIRSGGRKEAINALGCIKNAKIKKKLEEKKE